MIRIRAPAICGACKTVAAQGRVADQHRCVSCALVGAPVRDNSVHTNGIVTALAGPMKNRLDGLASARRKLLNKIGSDNLKEYNKYASDLVSAIRRGEHVTYRSDLVPVRVNGEGLAEHGNDLFELWQQEKTEADKKAFVKRTANTLVNSLTANDTATNRDDSRDLLMQALGPFMDWKTFVPDLLSISDEVADSMWRRVSELNRINVVLETALSEAWTAAFTPDGNTDMTLGEAIEDANFVLSQVDKFSRRVMSSAKLAASYLQKRYGASASKDAMNEPVMPDAVGAGTALLALADDDDELVKRTMDSVVAQLGRELYSGDRMARQKAASLVYTYLSSLDNEAYIASDLVDWAQCDAIGVDAVQQVDASLLRRAKEAIKKRTADKQYSTLVVEKELRKVWSTKMARHLEFETTADWVRDSLPDKVVDQPQVRETPERWRNFLLVAGNSFYRDGKSLPAPPAKVEMTQDEFVGKNRGDPNFQAIGDQLVNMSEYFNRRELQKQNIPDARVRILGPTGLSSVRKTAKGAEVVGDLQKMRRSLISDLQRVAANEYATKGMPDGHYPAAREVDQVLARMFQGLWEDLPSEVKDGAAVETFPSIMDDYQAEKGTPVQRRGNIITRFLSRRK